MNRKFPIPITVGFIQFFLKNELAPEQIRTFSNSSIRQRLNPLHHVALHYRIQQPVVFQFVASQLLYI